MKTHFSLSFLVIFSSFTALAKPLGPTLESMTSLMQEVRDPYFDSAKRKQYLSLAQTFMQKKLAAELTTAPQNLASKFLDSPSASDVFKGTGWKELQSEFYTSLHQEILYQRWQQRLQKKKVTPYGKNIADSMVFHLSKYSGVKEDRYYNRWHSVTRSKNGKSIVSKVPLFVFAPDFQTLTSLDAHVPFEYLLTKESKESIGNPSLSTLRKKTGEKSRDESQELAEKIQLNHRIYLRAVANMAKTVASVHYLTGEYTVQETESKVRGFLSDFCESCSDAEKTEYFQAAMAYTKNTRKELAMDYSASKVVTSFCKDLVRNGYLFAEKQLPTLKPSPVVVSDNTRVDRTGIDGRIAVMNFEAMQKTVAEHDLGVLFLTQALSRMSGNGSAVTTNLSCETTSLEKDIALVKTSIIEGSKNVEQYLTRINQKIREEDYTLKNVNDLLEYFAQTNVSATSEALMYFPEGINHVVDAVLEIDSDVKRRKRTDKVVSWGGTIVGIGLTITGIGAPEGVALLLTMAGMAKTITSGAYYLHRSKQEKAFYRELLTAKKGTGTQFYLNKNLMQHYTEYRSLKTSYLVEFSATASKFTKIYQVGLEKTGGDVVKTHTLLAKIFNHAKKVSVDVTTDWMIREIIAASI